MSRINISLCELIFKEYYGEEVSKVGTFVLKNSGSNINAISKQTDVEIKQVKKILCSLIQQNIVKFSQSRPGLISYKASPDVVMCRLRFPRYIHIAKTLYGDAAELLVEELLLQGQANLDSIVSKTTKKLNDSIISSGAAIPEINSNVIKEKVLTLVKARLIRRCEEVIRDDDDKATSITTPSDPETLFVLPSHNDFEPVSGAKRSAEDQEQQSAKRVKLEEGSVEGAPPSRPTAPGRSPWMVNVHQFHHHLRDQALVAAVARVLDQQASEVMRAMLRLSQTRSDPTAEYSHEVCFSEIFNAIPKDKGISKKMLDQYLRCLADHCYSFITRTGDSGGGMFIVNYFKATKAICTSHIETIILERFGSRALRMFKVIIAKKHVEQKQVEEQAMLPPKEAKELLYKMFAENYVTLTELSRTPDHAPARTIYLFNVNLIQVTRMVLEKCYKALINVMIRREKVISENKRLLDKQDRVEAIVASLEADSSEEQREEIQAMVTPSERSQLEKVARASRTLEQSEIHLDETVLLLETFLKYTLKPPPPKLHIN